MYPTSRNRLTVIIILVVLALGGLALHQTGNLGPFENFALGMLQPLLSATVGTRAGVQSLTGDWDPNSLRAHVLELQTKVDSMTLDNVRLRELENENKLLREQLAYKQANTDYDLIGATVLERSLQPGSDMARVIGVDPSNLVRYVLVDQGVEEGVRVAMPVVTPQGLVGRVTEVGTHWAKILLIIDPSSSVNAVVQSTRATGVVQGETGNLPTNNLIIRYVPQGEAIKTGDLILTSGLGGNFPKRLIIGQVTQVYKQDNELFQSATIQPTVDFPRLEFVLILKKFTPADITSEPTPTPAPKPTRTPTRAP